DWKSLIALVEEQHGRLDILVNNAGILQVGEIDKETLEGWRRVQSINTEGVFLGIQNALPLMEKSGGGSIVNMASVAAHFGMPYFVAYSASKAAVRAITQTIAVHCHQAGNNIRCNSVHPDGIATDMVMEVAPMLPQGNLDGDKALQAASYMSMPGDIAKVVLFLASDDSSSINGAEIKTDKSATLTPPYG
ncbi:MAG: SDR family oxidoreductase, partial [Gammaproteobacteria bacterium]|nr:SDR family oxidoreductase [Gammaproteobacteria bacterium]